MSFKAVLWFYHYLYLANRITKPSIIAPILGLYI